MFQKKVRKNLKHINSKTVKYSPTLNHLGTGLSEVELDLPPGSTDVEASVDGNDDEGKDGGVCLDFAGCFPLPVYVNSSSEALLLTAFRLQ